MATLIKILDKTKFQDKTVFQLPSEAPSLTTGLQAFYKLDDLTDSSGNGNTLTNNGDVSFASGKLGNAAVFDGSNYFSSDVSLDMSQSGSISLWVKSNDVSGWQTILGGTGLNIGVDPTNSQLFVNDFSSMPQVFISGYTPDDSWVHLTVVADASDLKIYFNGSLNASATNGLGNPTINIGGTGNENFIGSVDAVGIWNRALSDAEVAELYNTGTGLELN
jgi:hypothetical protein